MLIFSKRSEMNIAELWIRKDRKLCAGFGSRLEVKDPDPELDLNFHPKNEQFDNYDIKNTLF
jgi:hypothetical protein